MSIRREILAITLLVVFSGFAVFPAQARDYDLVILNGRVMDPESKFDAVRNVGIKDGKIAKITKRKIKGKETINAKGHVVAPGFVDGHFHNVVTPFGQKLGLRDGVTSAMELEFGVLPVDEWYDSWVGKAQTNYGATASLQAAREMVFNPKFKSISGASISDMEMGKVSHFSMDWSQQIATSDEVTKILALVEEGVKQGALGVGYTPGYMEFGVTTEEGVGAQRIAGKYGRVTAMHGRFYSQKPPSD
jgi:imidazolonepropionase-like amidohydrolase